MSLRSLLRLLPEARREAVKERLRRMRYEAVQFALSYTPADLEAALRRVGVQDGDAIVMQSAFSPINGFDGEPQHVIDCVLDVIGPRGHLFMVSMPYDGSAREYLTSGATFDVRRTPSQMGVISESFRRRKTVLRSANPLHPVLAWGPRADWVVAGHERLSHSCGQGSPFEKMLQLNAKALLFDVDLDVLTFTHYLEDLFQESAPIPVYASEPLRTEVRDRDGLRRDIAVYPFSTEAMSVRNFGVLYDALIERGLVKRERVGNTRLQLTNLEAVVATATELVDGGRHLYGNPGDGVRVRPTRHGTTRRIGYLVRHELLSRRGLRDARKIANRLMSPVSTMLQAARLPASAKHEVMHDHRGLPALDPGIDACTQAAIAWLCEAQDSSSSRDGGVAHDYSLVDGWSASYPETTGYVIPTMLDYAKRTGDDRLLERGRRMLDWLVSIQLPDGAFQGGIVGAQPVRPVTFNTGQILIGLAAGAATFGDPRYLDAMHRAARWLVKTQDADGCWRAFPSPFTPAGEKTYDTHVAWGLFEAARVAPAAGYEQAAIRNVRWAITHQRGNGWFGRSCVDEPTQPLTHGIGYVLRGILEAYRFTGEEGFLNAAMKTADALANLVDANGFLPGRLRSDWSPAVSWACLTGSSQLAHCWLMLYDYVHADRYLQAAQRTNRYVRRTIHLDGPAAMRGGVKGSFPVDGGYCTLQFPNWAAKFMIDANLAERQCVRGVIEPPVERQTA